MKLLANYKKLLHNYIKRKGIFENSNNPFALIVLTFLKIMGTKSDMKKLNLKILISRMVYEKKLDLKTAVKLLRFIDWIITLPENLEIKYNEEIKKLEGVSDMAYITSFERIGFKKGIEKGIEKGKEEGIIEGELNKSKKVALNLIKMNIPLEQIAMATELPIEAIQEMAISN